MAKTQTKIDTTKFFLKNIGYFIKYVFSGQVLPILVLFSVLILISAINYIFYAVVIIPMVYKFAFDILADTARGNMTPMVRENYLVSNVVIIKVVIISAIIELIEIIMRRQGFSQRDIFGYVVLTTFLLPAVYMILALTNSVIAAFNPAKIFKIVNTAFAPYATFVVFWTLLKALYEWVLNPIIDSIFPIYIDGIVSSFFKYAIMFLAFHIMGYILYQYRREFDLAHIGLITEDQSKLDVKEVVKNPIHTRISQLLKDNEIETAVKIIVEQQKEGDNSKELNNLFKNAMNIKMANPQLQTPQHKIHHNISKQQINKAFEIFKDLIENTDEYTTNYPDDVNVLIAYCMRIRKPQYIAPLINNFDSKYPKHKDLVANYFLYAKSFYEDRDTRDKAKQIVVGLITDYPDDDLMPEIKSWYKGLELMAKRNNLST